MNTPFKKVIVLVTVIVLAFLDILSFVGFFPSSGSLPKNSPPEELSKSLKEVGRAIDFLKKQEEFSVDENGETGIKKMEILNGSGISGKARIIKESLGALENSLEIVMGNTEVTTESIIKFKESVSGELKTAILGIVIKETSQVKEEGQKEESPFDITLVVGSE